MKADEESASQRLSPSAIGFYESHSDSLWKNGINQRVQLHIARSLLRTAGIRSGTTLSVLEVGSGFGFVTQSFRDVGITDYVGVEPTTSLRVGLESRFPDLEFADERMPKLSRGVASRRQKFDLVIAVHVIEHAPNPQVALEWCNDLVNCLIPGTGRLVLVTPDISSYRSLFWSVDYTHSCPFSIDSLPQLLRDAGLVDVTCTRTRFGSSDVYTRLVMSVLRAFTPITLLDNASRATLGRPLATGLATAALLSNLLAVGRRAVD